MKKMFCLLVILIMASAGYSQTAKKWLNKGLAKFDQHDYFGAMGDYINALHKNPKLAEAYYLLIQ